MTDLQRVSDASMAYDFLSESRHARAVVETARTALLVLDDAFTVVMVNPSFLDTYGLSEEEVLGQSLFAVRGRQ